MKCTKRFNLLLLQAGLRLHRPGWIAQAWRRGMKPIISRGPGAKKVLAISRKIGDDDLKSIAAVTEDLEIWILPKQMVRKVLRVTLGADTEYKQIDEWNYHHAGLADEGKAAYRDVLIKVLQAWQRTGLSFDGFTAANFGYPIIQEWIHVCRDFGIKTVILHKEGLAVPGRWNEQALDHAKRRFGDAAVYYNESIKEAMIRNVFPGTEKVSAVAGIPRLDRYFGLPRAEASRFPVLFFSSYPQDKYFFLKENKEKYETALLRSAQFHRDVIRAAASRPQWPMLIKTKSPRHFVEYARKIFEEEKSKLSPGALNHVTLTGDGDPFEMIRDAKVVLSHASTVLIEALIANRPVLSFEDRDLAPEPSDFFGGFPNLVTYGDGENSIGEWIDNNLEHEPEVNQESREAYLKLMVHTPDGKASQRAGEALLGFLS